MKFNYLLIILWLLTFSEVSAQLDTIIVYNVNTQVTNAITPVWIDSIITFDKTDHSLGLMNQVPLSVTAPTSNLYSGTEFMKIERAELYSNLTDFPISAATRLFIFNQDTLGGYCSGILVSENLVLTAAHCIRNYSSGTWKGDSILIATGYDNGEFHTSLPSSIVSKYYIFKSYYSSISTNKDYALLELAQPIGQQTGWIGMGFTSDTNYYSNKVFHKLSYPADASMVDTSIHVNGDTLYYNYGKIDVLNATSIGLISSEAKLIPGQSGSSLFYTDNIDYYSMAIAIYSSQYRHFAITNEVFYQFKNVMDNYVTASVENVIIKNDLNVYPNPLGELVTIEFSNTQNLPHTLTIFNSIGDIVTQEITRLNKVRIDGGNLTSGLYILRLENSKGLVTTKKMIKE